jgi:two-component system, cell cycle sensor histidine kinase and response regulator CckA
MKEHILLVDDDDLVRSGLAQNLERAGFEVAQASSGQEALSRLAQRAPDLVLCDLVLGDMTGMDLLRRCHSISHDLRFVMITGYGSVSNALDALQSGASDYIQKPVNPDEVIHRIRAVLDAVHLRKTLSVERSKAEERKRDLHEQLIRTERMASLGMLAEGAAQDLHDICAPMQAALGRMRKLIEGNAAAGTLLQEVEEATGKAAAIIQDLQVIGRRGQYTKVPAGINSVVESVLDSPEFKRLSARRPGTRVDVRLGHHLPPVLAAASQLETVVLNLLTQAFESMPGGGTLTVSTTSEHIDQPAGRFGSGQPGDYIVLSVADTGIPLRGEDVERIFEPFYTRKVMGRRLVSGLGMTLVYSVVDDHDGFLDIRSEGATGNRFFVFLPVAQAQGDEPLDLRPDYTGRETILVVDDYAEHRAKAADVLRSLGYEVMTAESGRAAVGIVESLARSGARLDLIVLDLVLGDNFDGVETYKKVIQIKPGQRAVLYSGFSDLARIVEARKMGITQCLQKPYTLDNLGKAVRRELDAS